MTQESPIPQLTQSRTSLDFTIDPFEKDPHYEETKHGSEDVTKRFISIYLENQSLKAENYILRKELELNSKQGVMIRGKRVIPISRKELMKIVGCKDPRTLESKYGFRPMGESDIYDFVECIEKLKAN